MKIKGDFVTNSSSTSYMVYIPNHFHEEDFMHLIKESDIQEVIDCSDKEEKEIFKLIKENIEMLKNKGIIRHYDNVVFWVVRQILSELDLVVAKDDTCNSYDDIIFNANSIAVKEKKDVKENGGWGIKNGGWGK